MFNTNKNVSNAGREMQSMISEAEQMLNDAKTATGDKAGELQKRGMQLLSSSISKAHELERIAIDSVRDIANSTDQMVQANPWRSVAGAGLIGAGLGLVIGMALARE